MLPKQIRLSQSNYKNSFKKKGMMFQGKHTGLLTADRQDNQPTRFATIIGKKIEKRATKRNKIKRRIQATILSEIKNIKPGYDCLILVKKSAIKAKHQELQESVIKTLEKAKLSVN